LATALLALRHHVVLSFLIVQHRPQRWSVPSAGLDDTRAILRCIRAAWLILRLAWRLLRRLDHWVQVGAVALTFGALANAPLPGALAPPEAQEEAPPQVQLVDASNTTA